MKSVIIWALLILTLVPIAGCMKGYRLRLPIQSPWEKIEAAPPKELPLKDKLMDRSTTDKLFKKADSLMGLLILGGVAGLVLALWLKIKEALFVTIACWAGSAFLVALASWGYLIGILLLAAGLVMLVLLVIRWKRVADYAIKYGDKLKKHVSEEDKEKVNAVADETQPVDIKKAILKARKME